MGKKGDGYPGDSSEKNGDANRRRFLKGVGALGVAGAAGCLGDGDGEEGDTPTATEGETPTETEETETDTETETETDTETETPTPEPTPDANFAVLVLSVTKGFRHNSIENGNDVLETLIGEMGDEMDEEMTVDFIDNQGPRSVDGFQEAIPSTVEEFEAYDAVVFQNTTGSVLDDEQQAAFREYIENGGGWMGIHAGSDTHKSWDWYDQELSAATFADHPAVQEAEIHVTDRTHPATQHLPARWTRTDEWYDFNRNPRGNTHVLATLDERTYDGANMDGGFGRDHPTAWCHSVGQGRAFYTGGGHTVEAFDEDDFQQHLTGGLMWAAGYVQGDYYGTVWDAYEKETILADTADPMAIDVADDGTAFVAERGGTVKAVTNGASTTVADIDVYTGQEDGLLGIALDPDFADNGHVFLYHSPPNSELPDDLDDRLGDNHLGNSMGVNRISRFTFEGGSLGDPVQILDVVTQRSTCCHAGGPMDFDSEGNLYLATGDDTNPFESSGRTPIDERDGREPFDAQRSSGNTNDLRGSVVRISPNEDGSYDIPEGNLPSVVDGDQVRDELYAIGFRNPFTMRVDTETDTPYVGDYGPDAGGWSSSRGPLGQTEFARLNEPGFYGWPYFTGPNIPYKHYDFDTGDSGRIFDPDNPTNDSVNNTGVEELPTAQGAFVPSPSSWGGLLNNPSEFDEYMPYDDISEVPFPQVSGGAPTQGPVYRHDEEFNPASALHESFDGKVFLAEWGGGWIKYATLDDDGEVMEVDPFLPDVDFARPHDMTVGSDGSLYVIDWGGGFGGGNDDAEVARIGPSGEILPVDLSASSPIDGGEILVTSDQPIGVEATITNGGSEAVDGVELSLEPSNDDIVVGDGSNTSVGSLGAGASATAEWTVTLPADLEAGDYTISAVATYTSGGTEFEISSAVSFTVQ